MQGMTAGPSLSALTKSADAGFKRPLVTSETQTEVDENGLWDKQDGWSLPITGTLIARYRWRQAILFSRCPSCRGIGQFVALTAKLLKQLQRGGGGQLMDENRKARGKTGAIWQIPDSLVRFMSNIPRSVMAISPKPLVWVVRRIWYLLEQKCQADAIDDAQGLPSQEVEEHLIEAYLIRSEKRSDAELELYVLLSTMKEHYQKHVMVHTYARFVGVLDGLTTDEIKRNQEEKDQAKLKKAEAEKQAKYKKMSARDRTNAARADEEEARIKAEREMGKPTEDAKMMVCDASLSLSILAVYHFARRCLLEPYHGGFAPMIARVKAANEHLRNNGLRLQKEQDLYPIDIPDHICVDSKYQFYLPLDRALRVTQAVISFLEEAEYNAALRALEHAVVFLNADGTLGLPEGMHTLIRSTVREFLACTNTDGHDQQFLDVYNTQLALGKLGARDPSLGPMTETELQAGRMITLVNMDTCLRIICECLVRRTTCIEQRLADIFIEGDVNHDGVLSFGEFKSILTKVAPHFTDRRILRMYREALSMGNDDDTIGSTPFVIVCKKHGLVSLVDIRGMQTGSLLALCKTQEQKEQEKVMQAEQASREAALATTAAQMFATSFRKGGSQLIRKTASSSTVDVPKKNTMPLNAAAAPAGMIGNVPPLGRSPAANSVVADAPHFSDATRKPNKEMPLATNASNMGSPAALASLRLTASAGAAVANLGKKFQQHAKSVEILPLIMHDGDSDSDSSAGHGYSGLAMKAPASPIATSPSHEHGLDMESATTHVAPIVVSHAASRLARELQMTAAVEIPKSIPVKMPTSGLYGQEVMGDSSDDEGTGIISRRQQQLNQASPRSQNYGNTNGAGARSAKPSVTQSLGVERSDGRRDVDSLLHSATLPANSIEDLLSSLGGDEDISSTKISPRNIMPLGSGPRNPGVVGGSSTSQQSTVTDANIGFEGKKSLSEHSIAKSSFQSVSPLGTNKEKVVEETNIHSDNAAGGSRFTAVDIKSQLAQRRDKRLQERLLEEQKLLQH